MRAVLAKARASMERRVKIFCVTCSFAPDDLFFPVILAAAIKGTWYVCIYLYMYIHERVVVEEGEIMVEVSTH